MATLVNLSAMLFDLSHLERSRGGVDVGAAKSSGTGFRITRAKFRLGTFGLDGLLRAR
jgi:hypothetical protein